MSLLVDLLLTYSSNYHVANYCPLSEYLGWTYMQPCVMKTKAHVLTLAIAAPVTAPTICISI